MSKRVFNRSLDYDEDAINAPVGGNIPKKDDDEISEIEDVTSTDENDDVIDDLEEIEETEEIEEEEEEESEDEEKEIFDENDSASLDEAEKVDKNDCIYEKDNSDDDIDIVFDDDNVEQTNSDIVPPEERKTKPALTKYERVRIIGDRTQQLTLGAKPLIKNAEIYTPKEIAEIELKLNVIPLIIQRPLPNGKKEQWFLRELLH